MDYEVIKPEFSRDVADGDEVLKIVSAGEYSYGKWHCDIDNIEDNATYRFSIKYFSEHVPVEGASINAVFTWIKEDGEWLERGYIDGLEALDDGWKILSKTISAPREAFL
ncbi:MAG TPA: hypothetical protein VFD89_01165 [Clostridia bacterium]|nr:hypothetical protein [Clostridia bacterium]